MTARPDGTALWLRGTNEVVDGKEGLPPSISPLNTSCEGLRDRCTLTVAWNTPHRTHFQSQYLAQNIHGDGGTHFLSGSVQFHLFWQVLGLKRANQQSHLKTAY